MSKQNKEFIPIATSMFGSQEYIHHGRLYKKNGDVNVDRKGISFLDRLSWFHYLVSLPGWKFYSILACFFIGVNLVFAVVYYFIGIEYLVGIETHSEAEKFAEAFFFSAQTFTTVGYGRISPTGLSTNAIAAFEAFVGMLSFALASGLFYGRFAQPKAYLLFSKHMLISPYDGGNALMCRVVSSKKNHLLDAEVRFTVAMKTNDENGPGRTVFYNLPLAINRIDTLALSWTIVHPIDDESPLYQMDLEQMKQSDLEILVQVKGYDEDFSSTVAARTAYDASDIIEQARFLPMLQASTDDLPTFLHIDRLNDYEKL